MQRSLDCCLRRKDTWGAGRTRGPPHPASLDGWPPSPARGEADWVPACAGRTLWPPHPAVPWAPPASPAVGRGGLDCCLRRKDTCWVPAYAGRTLWPPHPARPSALPPARPGSAAVGRGEMFLSAKWTVSTGSECHNLWGAADFSRLQVVEARPVGYSQTTMFRINLACIPRGIILWKKVLLLAKPGLAGGTVWP